MPICLFASLCIVCMYIYICMHADGYAMCTLTMPVCIYVDVYSVRAYCIRSTNAYDFAWV